METTQVHHFLLCAHMGAAWTTVSLFVLRLGLDLAGRPGWRQTTLRWLPHVNDTVLLAAAVGLLLVTGWMPFVQFWLTCKVLLLLGYIGAGMVALRQNVSIRIRKLAGALALLLVSLIILVARTRPA